MAEFVMCEDCVQRKTALKREAARIAKENRRKADPDYYARKQREYNAKNLAISRERCSEYYKNNRDKLIEKALKRIKKKYQNDPLFRKEQVLRQRIRLGWHANGQLAKIIGCTFQEFHAHLELTLIRNYGSRDSKQIYEIDHIIPTNSATTEEELLKLFHYTNTQYLTRTDNRSKGPRIKKDPT